MKTGLRTLLVDDERPARNYLRRLLAAHPEIEIVGEAANVTDAARIANDKRPELLFVDIQMSPENGFALLPRLEYAPHIIFVTGYDHYAVRAFEVNAVDYLLKPVRPERLATAIGHLGLTSKPTHADPAKSVPFQNSYVILLSEAGRHYALPIARIGAIASEGNFTRLYQTDGETLFLRRTLAEWETLLPNPPFFRADRSLLFNLSFLRGLTALSRDEAVVKIEGVNYEFELGRAGSTRLRKALRSNR